MKLYKRFVKKFQVREKGFTLIEMLIVVAILGVLSAVAVPSVNNFLQSGKSKAYETELHSVELAAMAMIIDSDNGKIEGGVGVMQEDLSLITAPGGGAITLKLSDYVTGLDGTKSKNGCKYSVTAAGVVTQQKP